MQNKVHEFKLIISDHPHIDVIFLQGTFNPTFNIHIPGYRLYHTLRVVGTHKGGGGTAIYIKQYLPHYQTHDNSYNDI